MELDGSLALPEPGPGEEGQTEVDRGGVEGIHCLVQLHAELFVRIELPGCMDQGLGEVGVDTPVAGLVGMGERVP